MTQHPFQFQHRPFAAAPDVNNYVPTESVEASIDAVYQCVQRSAGPALVIGPTGIGKSMLCVELARRLGTPFEMVLRATSQICTRRALLQNILFELGLNFRDREEGELRLGILDHLKSPKSTSSGVLLIIDEAQTMPLKLLEEIRGLTNIQRQGQSRVHLVLAGNQRLDERLNHPKMEAFTQRIAARCYLQSLNRQDTHNFIGLQWTRATGNTGMSPFSEAAIDAVYAATNGIPRLINQLCDHTLYLASARNITDFTDELIGEAWSDLQQLPTP
ncbi:MAG: AAA family ATPase, partial [Planctomycetota bacterium]|nr:AAA family ATPase [Planctomycetota bacterium]